MTTRPTGSLADWVVGMRAALAGTADADVPCDGCTACCTAAMFLEIDADEVDTLAHIPAELLIHAPELDDGQMLVGYDADGHCHLLVDGMCSIYEHRPRTCRTFDCRVFPATDIDADDERPFVALASRRWIFDPHDEVDLRELAALRAAAASIDSDDLTPLAHAFQTVGISAEFLD